MTEQPNDTDWLAGLEDAVRRKAYDCDCQVGGVDAMSIDTDFLAAAVAGIRADMAAREAAADRARRVAQAHIARGHDPECTQDDDPCERCAKVHAGQTVIAALDGDRP